MKMLEQKERETLERLKNTMNEQNIQLQKMEQVMTESKQGFYQRVASSVSPKKTDSSTDFQRASTKSGKGGDVSKKAVEMHQEENNEDSQEDNYEDFQDQNNEEPLAEKHEEPQKEEHEESQNEKHDEPLEENHEEVKEESPAPESEPVNIIVESDTPAPKEDEIAESNKDLNAEVED
jgi:hypothetical protein